MFIQQRAGFTSRAAHETDSVANVASKAGGKGSKRRRRLLITGGGIAIGAAVVTINDDAKHAYVAAQRSYRVLSTLVLNIREYVHRTMTWWPIES